MCTFTLERVNFHRLDVYMRVIDWVFGILRRIGSFWEEHVLKWHKYKMGKWFLFIKSQVMIQCSGSVLQMINLKKCHYPKKMTSSETHGRKEFATDRGFSVMNDHWYCLLWNRTKWTFTSIWIVYVFPKMFCSLKNFT